MNVQRLNKIQHLFILQHLINLSITNNLKYNAKKYYALIFKLKINYMLNIYKLKQSNIKNDTTIKNQGISVKDTKYNPAFSREWYNSVYTFNKNTVKSLPSDDVYVSKLIKMHFNLFSKKLEGKTNIYSIRLRSRRKKVNRVFIAKPEFKHTNDKVIITLYIYNQELLNYEKKLSDLIGLEYLSIFNAKATKNNVNSKDKLHIIKNLYTRFIKEIKHLNTKYLNKENYSLFNVEKFSLLEFVKDLLIKLRLYLQLKKIIHLNKSKFNSIHIFFLRNLLKKVYGKNVEFNIVNLKNYRLNTSIFTQILAIKIKNKRSTPSNNINEIVSRVRLPYGKLITIPYNISNNSKKQNLIIRNTINNNYIKKIPYLELPEDYKVERVTRTNSLNDGLNLPKYTLNKVFIKKLKGDKLNSYLKYIYPKQYLIRSSATEELHIKSRNLENTVLDNIKNKAIGGIRIESAGRLARRISGRAVSFAMQKGTTRNVYSSYKGISSVLLRGNLNNNVDYIKSDYTAKLGSFGIKGWISSI